MNLKSGINLGGFLSQCQHSEEHYNTFITESDVKKIAGWGLDHVRLPIDYEVLEDEEGNTKKEGFDRVKEIIGWAKNNGLNIILDLHKAPGYDFNNSGNGNEVSEANNLFNSEPLQDRFVKLWNKMATEFGSYDNVALELLNEVVEEENTKSWNELIARTVDEIRSITKAPVIYGGIQWNSAKTVKFLEKPKHENIIFTFHFYEPLIFTHQKAYWVQNMNPTEDIDYPGTMEYYSEKSVPLGFQGEVVRKAKAKTMGAEFYEELITEAIDAAKAAGVGLYCGEFGVIDRAPVKDSLRWFLDVNEVFKKYNIGFSVWNYKEKDFGIADAHYDEVRDELIKAWTK